MCMKYPYKIKHFVCQLQKLTKFFFFLVVTKEIRMNNINKRNTPMNQNNLSCFFLFLDQTFYKMEGLCLIYSYSSRIQHKKRAMQLVQIHLSWMYMSDSSISCPCILQTRKTCPDCVRPLLRGRGKLIPTEFTHYCGQ